MSDKTCPSVGEIESAVKTLSRYIGYCSERGVISIGDDSSDNGLTMDGLEDDLSAILAHLRQHRYEMKEREGRSSRMGQYRWVR